MRKYDNVLISELKPYSKNARVHSEKQIEQIRKSIREFGFINPILVDENLTIISGHGRVEAAKLEKYKELPCIFVEDLTEEQKKAYILADNQLALNGSWDFDILKTELKELKIIDFDLDALGFNDLSMLNMDTDYKPTLEPQFSDNKITDELIEKRAKELATQMVREQKILTIQCPFCNEEFDVEN